MTHPRALSRLPAFLARLSVLVVCALASSSGWAQTTVTSQYFYDATGQLTRVVDSTGAVVDYVYDQVGNRVAVNASGVNPAQLSILGFSPVAGGPASVVTIQGFGFSPQAAANVVRFNGVQASVVSASASTLVAQVPPGASTGPISVTAGPDTAVSPGMFTVLALPIITSVAPGAIDALGPPAILHATGVNLAGATFAFTRVSGTGAIVLGAPQVNATGTSGTLPITLAPSVQGTFILVATGNSGSSSVFASAANTLTVFSLAPAADFDTDGLSNEYEIALGTSPTNVDTDADGMPDGWEVRYGFKPLDPTDAAQDADGDGATNLAEFLSGKDPRNPNTAPPVVAQIFPADGATNYPTNGVVVARFDKPLRAAVGIEVVTAALASALPQPVLTPLNLVAAAATFQTYLQTHGEGDTVVAGTVQVSKQGNGVPGTVSLSSDRLSVTFKPTQVLDASTTFAVVVQGLADAAGNVMTLAFQSSFTTGSGPDTSGPLVLLSSPFSGQQDVPIVVPVAVLFNKRIDPATLTPQSFFVSDYVTGQHVSGQIHVEADGVNASFVAAAPFPVGRTFTVFLYPSITDTTGNALGFYAAYFTTGFGGDSIGPAFTGSNLLNGDAGVARNAPVMLQFSEPINPITRPAGLQVTSGGVPTPGTYTFSDSNRRVTFQSIGALASNTQYTASFNAQLTDAAGNALTNPGSLAFTTGTTFDLTAPGVVATNPTYGDVGVGRNVVLRATFNERVNPLTVTAGTWRLVAAATGQAAAATVVVAADRLSLTLTPVALLGPSTAYYLTGTFEDVAGNAGSVSVSFTTGAGLDTTGPTVTGVAPGAGATGVPVNARVVVQLSEAIDATSVGAGAVTLTPAVAGLPTLGVDRRTVTFTPASPLAVATAYTVTVSGLRDTTGNGMTPVSSGFTTRASATADTTPPTVTGSVPADGASGVAVTTPVTLTLSEPVVASAVDGASVLVWAAVGGGTYQVAGTYGVTGAGTQIVFTPTTPWPGSTTITVYENSNGAITDLAGNALGFSWRTFTTAATPDGTAPVVTSVTPVDGAGNVGPNTPVVVTFAEPLNPTTVTSSTVALFDGVQVLPATISRSADNQTVMLTTPLPAQTAVTVVVTSGVTDLSGNPAVPFQSAFTTGTVDATWPWVVTQRPGSGATGVPATSPITLYTSEPLNAATVPGALWVSQNGALVAVTAQVTGNGTVIAITPVVPFAAGALVQVFLEATAQDLAGNPLQPFQGQFTIAPDVTGLAPTVVRTSPPQTAGLPRNAVFEVEVSEALDGATVTGATVRLWQGGTLVPATVTLRTAQVVRVVPTGLLAALTPYAVELTSGVRDLQGTALVGQLLGGFTTGATSDTGAPTVMAVSPPTGTTGVGVNGRIRVRFSEPINLLLVNATTVAVSTAAGAVPVSVSGDPADTLVTLTPLGALPASTGVTVAIAGVRDWAGNSVAPVTTTFTTSGSADTTAPTVVATNVFQGQTTVPVNTVFTVQFSEPVDAQSVTSASLVVYDTLVGPVAATVALSADGRTATLAPTTALAVGRTHSLWVNYGQPVLDLVGNPLAGVGVSFTTAFLADTTGPQVVGSNPGAGQTGVPTNVRVQLLFDEPVDPDTLGQITLGAGGPPLAVTRGVTNANRTVTITPGALLAPTTAYTVTVAGVRDTSGNLMVGSLTQTFTTAASVDLTPPGVVATNPGSGDVGVGRNVVLRATFNERVNPLTVTAGTWRVVVSATGQAAAATVVVAADRLRVTLTPVALLGPSTAYYLTGTFTDVAGNAGSVSVSFTTGAGLDTTGPTVTGMAPGAGATGVPVNARVVVQLSEAIDATSVGAGAVTLTPAVAGLPTLGVDRRTVTFTPASPLAVATAYTVTVSGLRDTTGNGMTPVSSSFTTRASGTADTTPPTVTGSVPADGASGVAVTTPVTLTLSEPVVASAVDGASVLVWATVGGGTYPVAGTYGVTAGGTQIGFTPTTPWPGSTTITVYVNSNSAITDLAGNALGYTWRTFTTAATPDGTAPVVTSVTPVDGAGDVGPNTPVVVTFAEPLNPTTVTSSTVALFDGVQVLPATISRSADNQTVVLTTPLPAQTAVTVVVTSGVTDLSGNPAVPFQSAFTTGAVDATLPWVVTQRPGSGATGVPATTPITLYTSEPLAPATVPGALWVSQNSVLIPVTVDVTGNGTAVTITPVVPFAAGALVQVFLEATAQDLAGNPLQPFQGQFTIAPDVTGLAPTVVRTSPPQTAGLPRNAVFEVEVSEALDGATVTGATVRLWQGGTPVPATVTLRTAQVVRVVPTGLLAALTPYAVELTSGVRDLQGTALVGQLLGGFTTGATSDTGAPTVMAVSPPTGTTGVGVNGRIRVRFSEPINLLLVNATTVAVSTAAGAVPVSVSGDPADTLVTLTPLGALPAATGVTVAIAGVRDWAGNSVAPVTTTFTTSGSADTTAPTVVATNVFQGQTTVPVNTVFTVQFSEPVDAQSVTSASLVVYDTLVGPVAATVALSADGRTATLAPTTALAVGRTHSLWVNYGQPVLDLVGNPLAGVGVSFTTAFLADTTGPQVVGTNPGAGQTGVPTNVRVQLLFDEPVDPDTLSQITLGAGGPPLAVTRGVTNANRTVTITPGALLTPTTAYTVTVAGVRDTSGNLMVGSLTQTFTTAASVDLTAPGVVATNPGSGDVGVGRNVVLRATFSERVNPLTVTAGTWRVVAAATGQAAAATVVVAADRLRVTLTPVALLGPSTAYYLTGTFTDVAGNAGSASVSFTTGAGLDTTGPTVTGVAPGAGATGVPVNARVVVQLSEAIDATSVGAAGAVTLTPAVAGLPTLGVDRRTVTVVPASPLAVATAYTVTVSGLRDTTGNGMTPVSSGFTTRASATADTTPPTVTGSVPADGASGVAVTTPVTLTLSEPVVASAVDGASVLVWAAVGGGTYQVAGTYGVTGAGTQIVFTPTTPWPGSTTITVYENSNGAITDLAGNALGFSWRTFTTAATPDGTAPVVTSVTPVDGAGDVGPNTPVVVTFAEPLNPTTVTSSTVALFDGVQVLPATISRSADNQTVMLTTPLPAQTAVTVVVTSGVTDLSGNPAVPFQSAFTTGTVDATWPWVVTQRPGSGATGVPATSPITLYTSEPLNAATVPGALWVSQNGALVAVTAQVTGNGTVIAITPVVPFAAGALVQVFLEATAQDLAGNPLQPFQGQFTIAPDVTGLAPTVVRTSPPQTAGLPRNAVFEVEVSEALDGATVTGATVRLWQGGTLVPATVTLRTAQVVRVVPTGLLAALTPYAVELTSGVRDLQGTALVGQLLGGFTTGATSDTGAPTVMAVSPPTGTTGVGVNGRIRVRFSEPINLLLVNATTVAVSTAAGAVPVSVSGDPADTLVTLTPLGALPASTGVTVAIAGVRDWAGNSVAPVTTTFTTSGSADTTAPTVVATNVFQGQTTVPVNTVFTVQFSEPVDAQSVTSASLVVYDTLVGPVAATVALSADGRTATLAPTTALAVGRTHSLYVNYTQPVLDLVGNPLAGVGVSFTTAFLADTTGPQVVGSNPGAGQTGVPTNVRVQLLFDESVDGTTTNQVTLGSGGPPLPVERILSNGNRTLTLEPPALLAPNSLYVLSFAGVRDTSGNPIVGITATTFTTGSLVDLTSPSATAFSPANGTVDVPTTTTVQITFSEPINALTVFDGNIVLRETSTAVVVPTSVGFSLDLQTVQLVPNTALAPGTQYTIGIPGMVTDRAGNTLVGVTGATFTTKP